MIFFLQYSQIVIIGASSLNYFQCTNDDKEGQSQLSVTPSSGCDTLHPGKREEEVLYSATTKDLECFYSPLGEPDLKDLPSFAYQISQGMVCVAKFIALVTLLGLFSTIFQIDLLRSTSPPWVSSTGTWPAATSWWMSGSCSRYQTLVSPETHPSMCPPSRTRCHWDGWHQRPLQTMSARTNQMCKNTAWETCEDSFRLSCQLQASQIALHGMQMKFLSVVSIY